MLVCTTASNVDGVGRCSGTVTVVGVKGGNAKRADNDVEPADVSAMTAVVVYRSLDDVCTDDDTASPLDSADETKSRVSLRTKPDKHVVGRGVGAAVVGPPAVGDDVTAAVGDRVGEAVGFADVGDAVGRAVGDAVGIAVGCAVG